MNPPTDRLIARPEKMAIVKFKSKAAADIVMFKNNAEDLFRVMGLELSGRGVIEPADLPALHAQLVAAINTEKMAQAEPVDETDLSAEEKAALSNQVSLGQRAYPLLQMMEAAMRKQVDVHWGF